MHSVISDYHTEIIFNQFSFLRNCSMSIAKLSTMTDSSWLLKLD